MEKYLDPLSKSILFKDVPKEEILPLVSNIAYSIKKFNKDDVIAIEGDDCNSLNIILAGNIEIHKPLPLWKNSNYKLFSGRKCFWRSPSFFI